MRVEADYRSRKQQELSEKLFRDLMSRYDVRINPPMAGNPIEPPSDEPGGSEKEAEEAQSKAPSEKTKEDKRP